MDLIGLPIEHKAFGNGVIENVTDGVVTVRFRETEKKFVYPDAFKNHLVLRDKKKLRHVTDRIAEKEAQLDQRRQMERREQERIRKLDSFTVTPNSHAVFNVAAEEAEAALADCRVSTGRYLSGAARGQCRIAERLKPNSACLITCRPRDREEGARRILGAFLVREDFFGEDVRDGVVDGHPEHRIILPEELQLPFWTYFSKDAAPRWGNTAFKYCSGAVMNQILSELVKQVDGTGQSARAQGLYRQFCKINRLPPLTELEPEEEE